MSNKTQSLEQFLITQAKVEMLTSGPFLLPQLFFSK